VVLNGLLSEAVYKHFLLLSVSIYCCLHSDLCAHYSAFARDTLTKFVNLAGKIYGESVLVYNVHSVIHIVDDVQQFGALSNISSFPFENHLRHMKKLIRRPGAPLQQLMCHLSEIDAHMSSAQHTLAKLVSKQHTNGPIPENMRNLPLTQYRECDVNGYKLKANSKDGAILLSSGEIAVVKNIICHETKTYVVYQQFMSRRSLHSYPFSSSDIDVCTVSNLSPRLRTVSRSQIESKSVCMPLKDGREFAVIPYAHKE